MLTLKQVLEYEVRSSFFAEHMHWEWMQKLCADYFSWKAMLRYKRYVKSKNHSDRLIEKYGSLENALKEFESQLEEYKSRPKLY